MTARVALTFKPPNRTGSAAGTSRCLNICHGVARSDRIRSRKDFGTLRSPTTVFISIGKKTINALVTTLLVGPLPNQITSSGA